MDEFTTNLDDLDNRLRDHIEKMWRLLFRELDDVKESVRAAAAGACGGYPLIVKPPRAVTGRKKVVKNVVERVKRSLKCTALDIDLVRGPTYIYTYTYT